MIVPQANMFEGFEDIGLEEEEEEEEEDEDKED